MKVLPLLNRLIQQKNESLQSLINRLIPANYYDSVSGINKLLGIKPKMRSRTNAYRKYISEHLNILSQLTLIKEDQLYKMTVHAFSPKFCSPSSLMYDEKGKAFFNATDEKKFSSYSQTKFCPFCLQEGKYHRVQWDLLMVTACLKHGVFLVDQCPECGSKIDVDNINNCSCKCGKDLSKVMAEKLPFGESIETQNYIQMSLDLYNGLNRRDPQIQLSIPNYFTYLDFLTRAMTKVDPDSQFFIIDDMVLEKQAKASFRNKLSNKGRHVLLCIAHKTLLNWPNNFYKFLEEYRKIAKVSHLYSGLSRDFGSFQKLFKTLKDQEFNFIKETFESYLLQKWDGGLIDSRASFIGERQHLLNKRKYISIEEASERLRLNSKQIIVLMEKGQLTYKINETANTCKYLIDTDTVDVILQKFAGSMTIDQTCEKLNVDRHLVLKLIETGFLKSGVTLSGTQIQIVDAASIKKFEEIFLSPKRNKHPFPQESDLINLWQASKLMSFLRGTTIKILKLISEGTFKYYVDPKERGIDAIKLHLQEIEQYIGLLNLRYRKKSSKNGVIVPEHHLIKQDNNFRRAHLFYDKKEIDVFISVSAIAKLLGIATYVVERWAERGFLKVSEKLSKNGSVLTRVNLKDYFDFRREFIFIKEAAILLNIGKSTVTSWIKAGRIKAYAGPEVDGGQRYLFKKSELLKFTPNQSMSTLEAAVYLGIGIHALLNRIKLKKIIPISGPGIDNMKDYLLSINDVDNLKKQLQDEITAPTLMGLLKVNEMKIREMIHQKKLNPISGPSIDSFPHYIFRISDVKPYLKSYSGPEAAQMIGVSDVTMRVWTKKERIRAISGPGIDGKKYYKYSLLEIENFREALDSLRQSHGEKAHYRLLTLAEVAEILGILKQQVWEQIQKGIIKPYRGPCIDGYPKYLFRPDDINRYKERMDSNKDLITANEAAKMLGEDLSWFYKKWVKTGRLKTISFTDKLGKHFFNRNDVQSMLKLKRSTVTGPQAAKLLNVCRNTILQWTKNGKLKPISGPDIDGFGCYLYLKKEISIG